MTISQRLLAFTLSAAFVVGCASDDAASTEPLPLLRLAEEPCSFTELVSPGEFDTTERSGVTADGRLFFIGTRPVLNGDSQSWLAEIVVDESSGKPAAKNLVAATLAGTSDGKLGGEPAGDTCVFGGMATHEMLVYAACYAADGRASLVQLDVQHKTVRAGDITTCNREPSTSPCRPLDVYLNGMAVDRQGRVYASSMLAHVTGGADAASIVQIEVGAHPEEPQKLNFRHRSWLASDVFTDGLGPNGVQIEADTLYYAGGANLNAVPIRADGSAGALRVYYRGPLLTYIDDFHIENGAFIVARAFWGDLTEYSAPRPFRPARQLGTCNLPKGAIPSSVKRMPDASAAPSLPVASRTYVVSSFFGGGLYTVSALR